MGLSLVLLLRTCSWQSRPPSLRVGEVLAIVSVPRTATVNPGGLLLARDLILIDPLQNRPRSQGYNLFVSKAEFFTYRPVLLAISSVTGTLDTRDMLAPLSLTKLELFDRHEGLGSR